MTTHETRRESFRKSQKDFNEQELKVITCLNMGVNHAWYISNRTGMLITSVRRALTDLMNKDEIIESGTIYYGPTQRNVTTYKRKEIQGGLF